MSPFAEPAPNRRYSRLRGLGAVAAIGIEGRPRIAPVDIGPSGDGQALVELGETVAVQDRIERGASHASTLSLLDGRVGDLGRRLGPHPGPRRLGAAF